LHFVGCHLQALDHDVLRTTHGLDMQMIRKDLEALDQKAQEPLECDTHCATDATQRYPLHQQAFDQRSGGLRDEVLCEAVNKLASTVLALVVLLAIVDVAIFLLDSIIIPLCWIEYLPLLTGSIQTGAIGAYNSSFSHYGCDDG
jgi:hypothetical protein